MVECITKKGVDQNKGTRECIFYSINNSLIYKKKFHLVGPGYRVTDYRIFSKIYPKSNKIKILILIMEPVYSGLFPSR